MENVINAFAENVVPFIIAIVGSSVVSTIITAFAQRRLRKAEIKEKEASATDRIVNAYDKTVTRLEGRIECIYKKLSMVEEENRELKERIDEIEQRYTERISILKHRVSLLAKLLAKIFNSSNVNLTLEEFIDGFQISEEDRCYLSEIINEVNEKGK